MSDWDACPALPMPSLRFGSAHPNHKKLIPISKIKYSSPSSFVRAKASLIKGFILVIAHKSCRTVIDRRFKRQEKLFLGENAENLAQDKTFRANVVACQHKQQN